MKCLSELEAGLQSVGILGANAGAHDVFEEQMKVSFKGIKSRFLEMHRDPPYFHRF